jgi:hypothetical protein
MPPRSRGGSPPASLPGRGTYRDTDVRRIGTPFDLDELIEVYQSDGVNGISMRRSGKRRYVRDLNRSKRLPTAARLPVAQST